MSTAESGTVEAQNKALVSEFMEVFSKGDVEAILAMMDDSATWWVGGTMEGISGTKKTKRASAKCSAASRTASRAARSA